MSRERKRMMSLTIVKNDGTPISDAADDPQGLIARLAAENAALRREMQQLDVYRTMAYRDPLTDLRNRRAFDERLEEECARARRNAGYRFSLILIDLDDFKTINDAQGHAVGDLALEAVSAFLASNVREVDLCFRLGGDEFALVLPDTDVGGCRAVIRRLRMGAPFSHGLPERIGLSVGVAGSPPDDPHPGTILAAADREMYRDKHRRKRRQARAHSA